MELSFRLNQIGVVNAWPRKFSDGYGSSTLSLINSSGAASLASLNGQTDLQDSMCKLIHASLATSTWSKYASGWRAFYAYEQHVKKSFSWPLSKDTLRGFAVFCISEKRLKPASVKSYLSSLVCLHKIKGFANYEIKDTLVDAILKGAGNLIMSAPVPVPNTRRVMTMPLLKHLGHRLRLSGWSKETQKTIWSACLTGFFATARMGELLAPSESRFDPSSTLTWACVKYRPDNSFLIHIRLTKSGTKEGEFIDIFPFPDPNLCPVRALLSLHKSQLKAGGGKPEDPVFTYPTGRYLTTSGLNAVFRVLLSDMCDFKKDTISCHSLRAGIPSALSRFPDLMSSDDVKGWGRWSSEAYQRYTRLKIDQKREIFMKIIAALMS